LYIEENISNEIKRTFLIILEKPKKIPTS